MKHNEETGKLEVDTETGDKIAKTICYTSAAVSGAAAGGVVGGNLIAAGGAVAAMVALHEADKRCNSLPVDVIQHTPPNTPATNDIDKFLPDDVKREIGDLVGNISASVAGTAPGDKSPQGHGINIDLQDVDGPDSIAAPKAGVNNSCVAKPRIPSL